MERKGDKGVLRRRRRQACLLVAAPLVALGIASAVSSWDTHSPDGALASQDPRTLLASAKEAMGRSMPDWFSEEVLVWPHEVAAVSEDGAVAALAAPLSQSETMELLDCRLAEKGWICVPSGIAGISSYWKEGGGRRWLLVSCFADGEGTMVVLQVQ